MVVERNLQGSPQCTVRSHVLVRERSMAPNAHRPSSREP